MRHRHTVRLLVFGAFIVCGLAVLAGLRAIDLTAENASTWMGLAAAVLGVLLIGGAWALLRTLANPDGTRFLSESVTLIEQGQAQHVLEAAQQRRQDDDRPEFALVQALALVHLGRGPQASRAVDDALRLMHPDEPGTSDTPGRFSSGTWLHDLAHVTRFNARLLCGEFAEAADGLAHYAANGSLQPQYAQTLVAFAYFLADDAQQAQSALRRIPDLPGATRYLSRKYQYMLGIMGAVLLRTDPHPDDRLNLRDLTAELEVWRDEARRNAQNPYGRRLAAVLTERPV